jgi:hypothetical protein
LILAIGLSTMIIVAIVVFATQYSAYMKNNAGRDKEFTSEGSVGKTREASGVA